MLAVQVFCDVYLSVGCRAGELTAEEVERLVTIVQNPRQFKVPDWMLNRKKDTKDGKFSQTVSNTLDMKLREDLERLKKIRAHRGLRHYCTFRVCCVVLCRATLCHAVLRPSALWCTTHPTEPPCCHEAVCKHSQNLNDVSGVPGLCICTGGLRVRGQRTKTTGRKGRTVGVSKKKG